MCNKLTKLNALTSIFHTGQKTTTVHLLEFKCLSVNELTASLTHLKTHFIKTQHKLNKNHQHGLSLSNNPFWFGRIYLQFTE